VKIKIKIRTKKRNRNKKSTRSWPGKPTYWVAMGTLAAYTAAAGSLGNAYAQAAPGKAAASQPAGQTQGTLPVRRFDIPPGPLSTVLSAFQRVSGLQVVVSRPEIGEIQSPGVSGSYTAEQGLEKLLGGTSVAYRFTATDTVTSSITGTSGTIAVSAAAATHFTLSAPASATAGTAFNFTVTAQDQFNNTATGYAGTVHFTSSDGAATLPANSTLTNGVGTFSATLRTFGSQTLTATDTLASSITGTSSAVAVAGTSFSGPSATGTGTITASFTGGGGFDHAAHADVFIEGDFRFAQVSANQVEDLLRLANFGDIGD
jgi:hypothetical protein